MIDQVPGMKDKAASVGPRLVVSGRSKHMIKATRSSERLTHVSSKTLGWWTMDSDVEYDVPPRSNLNFLYIVCWNTSCLPVPFHVGPTISSPHTDQDKFFTFSHVELGITLRGVVV